MKNSWVKLNKILSIPVVLSATSFCYSCNKEVEPDPQSTHLVSCVGFETQKNNNDIFGIGYYRVLLPIYRNDVKIYLNQDSYDNKYKVEIDKISTITSHVQPIQITFKLKDYSAETKEDVCSYFDLTFSYRNENRKEKVFKLNKLIFSYVSPKAGETYNVVTKSDISEILNSNKTFKCCDTYNSLIKCNDSTREFDPNSCYIEVDNKKITDETVQFSIVNDELKVIVPNQYTKTNNLVIWAITKVKNSADYGLDVAQFIKDRTFSIIGVANKGQMSDVVFGTCWIMADQTPSIYTDYKYYIATNWHVTNGWKELMEIDKVSKLDFYMSSAYISTDIIDYGKYVPLDDGVIKLFDQSKSLFSNEFLGIDMSFASVDLKSLTYKSQYYSQSLKEQLDTINTYQCEHHFINKFVNSDAPNIISSNKAIGGFPYEEEEHSDGSKWEFESIDISTDYVNEYKTKETSWSHFISEQYDDFSYTDASAQYRFHKITTDPWMLDGGSSGSMLVTNKCEVCGIYWGGWNTITSFVPSCSLFKTNDYNFINWLDQ